MKLIGYFTFMLLLLNLITSCTQDTEVIPRYGMQIDRSVVFKKDTFLLKGRTQLSEPAIIVTGENIVLDFNGAVILGSEERNQAHLFEGLAIEIKNGTNVTIKNAVIRGFKVAIKASDTDSLKILDADLSYNYRPKLKSTPQEAQKNDQLDLEKNEQEEWLSQGTAAYLKNCKHALVRGLKVTSGQHGLMISDCDQGLFYNNEITFNSGVGIALYQSSFNQIMHNKLDWNIRGFRFDAYAERQGSAGIFLGGNNQGNEIAYNSATHSGDGIFVQASDADQMTTKQNKIYENDFSYAAHQGIAVKASVSNWFYKNKGTSAVDETVLHPAESIQSEPSQGTLDSLRPRRTDGMNPFLKESTLKGRQYMIMETYGPYNFQYPALFLRKQEGEMYTFAIFGPPGNWKAVGGNGFKMMSQKRGAIPATLVLEGAPKPGRRMVAIEYIGPAFVDRFGVFQKKGKSLRLTWSENTMN